MQKQEALEILTKAGFVAEDPQSSVNLTRISKSSRLTIIRDASQELIARENCAAIEITRRWRGYRFRKKLKQLFVKNDTNVSKEQPKPIKPAEPDIPSTVSQPEEVKESDETEEILDAEEQLSDHSIVTLPISAQVSDETSKEFAPQEKSISSEETSKTEPKPVVESPAPAKQVTPPKPQKILPPFTRAQAATVIQKAWRRHIDMQVFRYYRDLINFRRQGNPQLMLRSINPAEAKLLDAATGTHIKFRLAGEKFPPNIYYKIYTHRPVQDMCANSPKDYTKAVAKQETSKQVHTKGLFSHGDSDSSGWYVREENNGWRLVSDRLIHAAMDPTTWETSKKKIDFHHDKLIRKSDLDKRRRQKKIAWMHKMYKQGMLQVKVQDAETSDLVKKAADGLINTVDTHGPDGVMDWEVDELLQWTTALNFDDYLEGWKETATSNMSEFEVEEMIAERSSKPHGLFDIRFDNFQSFGEIPGEKKEQTTAPTYNSVPISQPVENS